MQNLNKSMRHKNDERLTSPILVAPILSYEKDPEYCKIAEAGIKTVE